MCIWYDLVQICTDLLKGFNRKHVPGQVLPMSVKTPILD